MSDPSGWDADAVLADVTAPRKGAGHCWVTLLKNPAMIQTVETLNQYARDQRDFNRAALRRHLDNALGEMAPSREAVGRHFRGECACAILK